MCDIVTLDRISRALKKINVNMCEIVMLDRNDFV